MQDYFENYLIPMCDYVTDGVGHCILDWGSMFPQVSYVKRYINLVYYIDVGECKNLNRILKQHLKAYTAIKATVFQVKTLIDFITCETNYKDMGFHQDKLIAAFAFFGLGRGVEVLTMNRNSILAIDVLNDIVTIEIERCQKSITRKTVVVIPGLGDETTIKNFNLATLLTDHL